MVLVRKKSIQHDLNPDGDVIQSGRMMGTDNVTYNYRFAGGIPRVNATPYTYAIAEGDVPGHTAYTKLGYIYPVVNVEQDISPVGGKYIFPTALGSMKLVSTNHLDRPGQAGIGTIRFSYLGGPGSYTAYSETIALNGTIPVYSVGTAIYRLNAIRAVSTGGSLMALGSITITAPNVAGTPIYRCISTGYTRGRSLIYTVPEGKRLYINQYGISSAATAVGHFGRFIFRATYDDGIGSYVPFMMPWLDTQIQDGMAHPELVTPVSLPEYCDVVGSVIGDSSNSNLSVTGSWRGWLEDE